MNLWPFVRRQLLFHRVTTPAPSTLSCRVSRNSNLRPTSKNPIKQPGLGLILTRAFNKNWMRKLMISKMRNSTRSLKVLKSRNRTFEQKSDRKRDIFALKHVGRLYRNAKIRISVCFNMIIHFRNRSALQWRNII